MRPRSCLDVLFKHAANIRRLSVCSVITHVGNTPCYMGEGRHLGRSLQEVGYDAKGTERNPTVCITLKIISKGRDAPSQRQRKRASCCVASHWPVFEPDEAKTPLHTPWRWGPTPISHVRFSPAGEVNCADSFRWTGRKPADRGPTSADAAHQPLPTARWGETADHWLGVSLPLVLGGCKRRVLVKKSQHLSSHIQLRVTVHVWEGLCKSKIQLTGT